MDYPTLSRFFRIHFLLPLIVFVIVAVHIVYLHETGSKNPLGVRGNPDKVIFYPYFLSKDFLGFLLVPPLLIALFMAFPWKFMEYQKFIQANSLVTPPHIQPE